MAPARSARESLAWLREAYDADGTGSRTARRRAVHERLRAAGTPLARARALRRTLTRPRLPVPVVALSGLDGAGKSTQARLLVTALGQAGVPAVVLWDRISYNASLLRLSAPLRLVLRLVPGATDRLAADVVLPRVEDPEGRYAVPPAHRAVRGLRERLPVLSPVWVTLVVLLHAVPLRRRTLREAARGRLVVRDRYLLDSLVHLQARYGVAQVRLQMRLLRRMAPPPLAAFYLDLPAADAYERKPEEHPVSALEQHRELYLREAARLGVDVLEARRPAPQIADEVAAEVLRRLGRVTVP